MSSKYKQGNLITSVDDALSKDFIFWRNKVYHHGWFASWQSRWLKSQIQQELVYEAIRVAPPDPPEIKWLMTGFNDVLKFTCSNCGFTQDDDTRYCGHCGRRIRHTVYLG